MTALSSHNYKQKLISFIIHANEANIPDRYAQCRVVPLRYVLNVATHMGRQDFNRQDKTVSIQQKVSAAYAQVLNTNRSLSVLHCPGGSVPIKPFTWGARATLLSSSYLTHTDGHSSSDSPS